MNTPASSATDLSVIEVRVFRFDLPTGPAPHYASYSVPSATALTALEVLDYIYAHLDPHLAYRTYYCLKGVCLACLIRIDGKGAKGCERLLEPGRAYTLDPIHGYPVIRDLAVDFGAAFGAPDGAGAVPEADGTVIAPRVPAGAADLADEA